MDLVARHHADEMDAFEIQRLQVSTSCVRTSRVGDLELSEIIQLEPPCLSPRKRNWILTKDTASHTAGVIVDPLNGRESQLLTSALVLVDRKSVV